MNKQFCPYCMTPTIEGEACPNCGLTAGTYSPNQNHLPPGTILNDRYLVGRALGEGGFGITYIGCDLRLELKVAIKEYYPSDKVQRISTVSLDVSVPSSYAEKGFLSGKDRFLDEARVMARMDKQPEIVSVRDFFECHNTAYIVMEYVEGTTFKQMVAQRGGGIPPQELFPMLEPLFGALTNLHALGLIHRDISPDNLMLERGHVRLIDFGCARQPEKGEATMTIVLKHGYAPIEQYTNKGQGPWTDVYALSATIYYCLVGQTPPQAMDRAVDDDLILPRKLGVDLTEAQEKALLYGMGVKRRQRFASVAELYAALYKQAPTPEPEPVPVPASTLEYPVIGESERTMPASPVITVTEAEPKAKTEEQLEETPEAEKPEKPRKKKRPWWDNPLIGIGIAAAIVLLIALSLLLPKDKPANLPENESAQEGAAAPDSEPTDAPSADAPARAEVQLPPDDPFANAIELFPSELVDMAEQLDNGADYVTMPEFQYDLYVPYTLKGHLRIVEGSTANFNQMVTIPSGVVLQVEGILHAPEGIIVEEGGWLSILGTGEVRDGDVILYDMESAMSACSPIAVQNSEDGTGTRFMDLKQTEYHRSRATHVTSAEELLRAAEDLHTVMIVVDDTVTLEEHVTVTVPLVISEGATLHIPDDGTDDPVALTLQAPGSLLNHGTLNGMVFTHAVDGRAPAPMLNYAKMYLRGWLGADSTTIFNMAELSARHWVQLFEGVALYNRGTIHVDDGHLTVCGGMLRNCGEIIVDANGLEVGGSGLFTNDGSLTVKAGGTFANRSHSNSSGTIALQSGSRLENDGVLGLEQPLQAAPDVPILNSGLLITPGFDVSVSAGEVGRVMKLNYAPHETDGDYVSVSTKAELYDALSNDSVGFIEVNDEIELTHDVTLTKNMAVNGTLSLAGGVHLEIQSAVHVNGSLVSYNGGTIGVSEGGILMNYGEIVCPRLLLGEENIMENSGFFHNEGTLNAIGADVELHGESALMNWGRMEEVGHLLIGSGSVVAAGGSFDSLNAQRMTVDGVLTSINPLDLTNAEITVNGQFRTYGNPFSLNGSSSLVINEHAITDCLFTAWYLNDSSRIENRGEMHFYGFHELPVTLNSAMYNYGRVNMGVPMNLNWYLYNEGDFFIHSETVESLVSWGPDGLVDGNPLVPIQN